MKNALRFLALAATALQALSGWGCVGGEASARGREERLHLEIVCADGIRDGKLLCDGRERAALFDRWLAGSLYRPGSTFTVWAAGPDRRSYRECFRARIPEAWGTGVMLAKAAFVRAGREGASDARLPARDEPVLSAGAALLDDLASGSHEVRVLSSDRGSPFARSAWRPGPSGGNVTPLHAAIVCDRSDSTLGASCDGGALEAAFDLWARMSLATPGSGLTVYVAGRSRDTASKAFRVVVEDASPGERIASLIGAGAELAEWAAGTYTPGGSAIAESVSVASEELNAREGRRLLILLSDMRQQTPEKWNFERAVPPPERFVEWLRNEGIQSDLRTIPVLVCGTHHERGPGAGPYDAKLADETRRAWDGAFVAMGATGVRRLADCADLPGER